MDLHEKMKNRPILSWFELNGIKNEVHKLINKLHAPN